MRWSFLSHAAPTVCTPWLCLDVLWAWWRLSLFAGFQGRVPSCSIRYARLRTKRDPSGDMAECWPQRYHTDMLCISPASSVHGRASTNIINRNYLMAWSECISVAKLASDWRLIDCHQWCHMDTCVHVTRTCTGYSRYHCRLYTDTELSTVYKCAPASEIMVQACFPMSCGWMRGGVIEVQSAYIFSVKYDTSGYCIDTRLSAGCSAMRLWGCQCWPLTDYVRIFTIWNWQKWGVLLGKWKGAG